jgi:hypothetical protein
MLSGSKVFVIRVASHKVEWDACKEEIEEMDKVDREGAAVPNLSIKDEGEGGSAEVVIGVGVEYGGGYGGEAFLHFTLEYAAKVIAYGDEVCKADSGS